MYTLSNKEWNNIFNLILKTGMQNTLDNYINTVLKEIEVLIPYYAANFFMYNKDKEVMGQPKCINIKSGLIKDYERYYHKIDDIKDKTFDIKVPIRSSDIMDYRYWKNTEYFTDFLAKNRLYYSCGIDIHHGNKLLGTIGLFREKNDQDYTEKDLIILNIIKPHLANQLYKLFILNGIFNNLKIGNKLNRGKNRFNLTKREIEVVKQILDGKNNYEVAKNLFISINTVKKHLMNIYKKVEVNNRTELTSLILNL
ncbi:MAG: LuxR C-terminal-related transcriptional regulator [Bacillota bacterium]